MAEFQRGHHSHDQLIRHHQLDFPFLNLFDLPRFANKRLTAIQWAKLAEAQHLPRAMIINTDSPATGSEYGIFDLFHMTGRNEKAELIHSA